MHGWVNYWQKKPRSDGAQESDHFRLRVADFNAETWQDCANVGRAEGQIFTYGLVHCMDAVWSETGQKELVLALEDALHDRLNRLSLCDPDAQDLFAVQRTAHGASRLKRQLSSMSSGSSEDNLSRRSSLGGLQAHRGSLPPSGSLCEGNRGNQDFDDHYLGSITGRMDPISTVSIPEEREIPAPAISKALFSSPKDLA